MSQDPTPLETTRPRPARWGVWIGLAVLAAFIVFGLSAFQKSLTPYVSFDDARKMPGTVQVAGALVQGSDRYDTERHELHFSIIDESGTDRLDVVYPGLKPGNFNDAVSVVAIGNWDGRAIRAEKLLVKCPSKYQGEEVKEYSTGEVASGPRA